MYDSIGDDDLTKSYDPKKVAKNIRTPKLPDVEGQFDCILNRVKKDKTEATGTVVFEFKFKVTKSSSELVQVGGHYTVAFFPGAGLVRNSIFWEKLTPFMMAVQGAAHTDDFNAAEALNELKKMCDDDKDLELGLAFRLTRKLEAARKDKKTGQYNPKHVNADGTPKIFANDAYFVASAAPVAAPASAA